MGVVTWLEDSFIDTPSGHPSVLMLSKGMQPAKDRKAMIELIENDEEPLSRDLFAAGNTVYECSVNGRMVGLASVKLSFLELDGVLVVSISFDAIYILPKERGVGAGRWFAGSIANYIINQVAPILLLGLHDNIRFSLSADFQSSEGASVFNTFCGCVQDIEYLTNKHNLSPKIEFDFDAGF